MKKKSNSSSSPPSHNGKRTVIIRKRLLRWGCAILFVAILIVMIPLIGWFFRIDSTGLILFVEIGLGGAIAVFIPIFSLSYQSALEYKYWVMFMILKYPSGWDEEKYAFAPFFNHREAKNKGRFLIDSARISIYEQGINGIINFQFHDPHSTIHWYSFVPWDEVERISVERSRRGGGGWIFVETVDLKHSISTFGSNGELDKYLSILRTAMGPSGDSRIIDPDTKGVLFRNHQFIVENRNNIEKE